MTSLPESWQIVTFEEVVEVNPRKFVELGFDDLVTFVPMAAVSEVSGTIVDGVSRALQEVNKGFTQFADGDVIFAKITPSMENGKSAVASGLENGIGFGSTEFHVLRSRGAVSPEYLWYFVRQKPFREDAQKVMSGAVGQQRVPASYLKTHELPLPPFAEQKRIVAKINSLTARTTRTRNDLERIPVLVERYKKEFLKQAFAGELTNDWRYSNSSLAPVTGRKLKEIQKKFSVGVQSKFIPPYRIPKNWRWLALPEIGDLDRGRSKHRPRNDPRLFGGDYPFIQTGDVRAAKRFLTNYTETYSEFGLAQSRLWPTGTVCITIAANIAETAILGIKACFPDSIVGFLADKERVSPDYLEFFIRTIRDELSAFAPATAQKNINLNVLSSVQVPVPPLVEQTEIVRRIETYFAWLDGLSANHTAATKLLSKLEEGILSKAFRGELVPQHATDEPANTLLTRIRAEYEITPKPKRVRKARMRKDSNSMVRNIKEVLEEAGDWLSAQEVFHRCGIAKGAETDAIEVLYAEMRKLDKAGHLEVDRVTDKKGRKLHDRLKLKAA